MAKMVLTNAYISVNSVDLSDHIRAIEFDNNVDPVEQTTMGDAVHNFLAGLKNQTFTLTFAQDYASGEVDATLAPLVGAAAFVIEIRPVNTTVGATNPKWSGNVILTDYGALGGSVGDLHEAAATFQPGDGTGIVRATS